MIYKEVILHIYSVNMHLYYVKIVRSPQSDRSLNDLMVYPQYEHVHGQTTSFFIKKSRNWLNRYAQTNFQIWPRSTTNGLTTFWVIFFYLQFFYCFGTGYWISQISVTLSSNSRYNSKVGSQLHINLGIRMGHSQIVQIIFYFESTFYINTLLFFFLKDKKLC